MVRTAGISVLSLVVGLAGCTVSKIGSVDDTLEADTLADAVDGGVDSTSQEDTRVADTADTVDAADTEETDTGGSSCPWEDYGDGLVGGAVSWVGFDPRENHEGMAYAIAGGVLSRSTDYGQTWVRWSEWEEGFGALAFPKGDSKAVYATSGSGIIASADGGVSFQLKALGGLGIGALVAHPTSPQRMYAGTRGAGVFRSDDHGDTWVAYGSVPFMAVRSIAAPPDQPDVAVAGGILLNESLGYSNDGVLLYTDDGGVTWEVVEDDIGWADDVTFCGDDGQTVFAAARKSAVRSDDGGQTWAPLAAFAGLDVVHIAVASDCQTIYAMAYTKGVYRSEDGGDTAVGPFVEGLNLEPGRENANRLVASPNPDTSGVVFAATYAGLFRSDDAGETWAPIDAGTGVALHTLEVSADAESRLLGATWGTGLWRRDDAAGPWERESPEVLPRDFVYAVHADPRLADRWFVASTTELWRTTDGGATYEAAGLQGSNVFDMAFLGDGTLLAATQVHGVQRSIDGGDTWTASNGGLTAFSTEAGTFIDTRHLLDTGDGVLYLGTNGGGLFASDDSGASWARLGESDGITRVVAMARDAGPPAVLYVVTDSGVRRSDDGGDSWSQVLASGLVSFDITGLTIDPGTGRLYLSTLADGVYWSDDAESWSPFDRYCVPVNGFDDVAIITDADGTWLVATQSGGGVYRDLLRASGE